MKFNNKKVIIFDLDGTLIDSAPDLAVSVNFTLQSLQMQPYPEDTIRYWVGNGAQILIKRALLGDVDTTPKIDETLFNKALSIFLEHYKNNLAHKTKLYPNVMSTLQELKSRGYQLVIVTNKPYDFIQPILEGLEIKNLFELCLGGDSLEEKKPSPMPLLHVCEKLEVGSREVLMVGDSKNDILSAVNAKIESIGVTYGYNYGEPISSYNPTVVVNDFGAISALIGEPS